MILPGVEGAVGVEVSGGLLLAADGRERVAELVHAPRDDFIVFVEAGDGRPPRCGTPSHDRLHHEPIRVVLVADEDRP